MRFGTPKTWAPGEVPRSGTVNGTSIGLNDVVTAMATAINNIHNEQIANIGGSRFLDGGVPEGKFQSKSVTVAKLTGTDLMTIGEDSDTAGGSVSLTNGSVAEVDAITRAVLGGPVFVIASLHANVFLSKASAVNVWLKRADSPSGDNEITLWSQEWGVGRDGAVAENDNLPFFVSRIDVPGAGTFKWWVEAQMVADGILSSSVTDHHLWIAELR